MFRTVKLYSILFQNKEDLYFQTDIDDSDLLHTIQNKKSFRYHCLKIQIFFISRKDAIKFDRPKQDFS